MPSFRLRSAVALPFATLALGFASPAGAALTSYEGFGAYAAGAPLIGLNGGTGWAGAWAAANPLASVTSSGLAFGALATAVGAATSPPALNNPPAGSDITFEVRQAMSAFGADGTMLYLSFLLRPESAFGFYGGLNLGPLFIGKSGDPVSTYSLEGGGNIASSGVAATAGETVLLVLRAQFLAGDDVFDLFVNPVPGAAQPGPAEATLSNFDLGGADSIFVNNAGAWTIDEIRIGSTFADVTPLAAAVPELPMVALLATSLGLGWLTRRRMLPR